MADAADETREGEHPRSLGHVPALDGIRGIAIIAVVAAHSAYLTLGPTLELSSWYSRAVRGGVFGVDIFFVLSGFLITALLLNERPRIHFLAFYMRRALRLLPALWVMLAVYAVYQHVRFDSVPKTDRAVVAAFFYVTNWVSASAVNSYDVQIGHLWSLAVEEQFYLVWPLVVLGLVALRRPRVGAAIIAALAVLASVQAARLYDDNNLIGATLRTDTRSVGVLVGALGAWAWVHGWNLRWLTQWAWPAAIGVVAMLLFAPHSHNAFWYHGGLLLFVSLVVVPVLAAADSAFTARGVLTTRPLVTLGRVSYGLYLWNLPIMFIVAREDWSTAKRFAVAFPLLAIFTWLSWRFVERPALRLRRKFRPGQNLTVPVGKIPD